MGARITGAGSNLLEINGMVKLKGARHEVSPDNIEVGTFAIAAAVTGGEIEIINGEKDDLDPILNVLAKMGVKTKFKNKNLLVFPSKLKAISKVTTGIWPAFPTDLMSCLIVLATQAKGITLLHDWMYESRMFFVDKLISMGANVTIADPHRVLVYGPTRLRGQVLDTPDIRAGMALILAALVARGASIIDKIELVERGYERIEERLKNLGAKIKKVE
jgi:UDP-N-acetylglucosamine 1-carboxyvinyltransferase